MARRWTILVLGEHASRAQQYSVSQRQLKAALSAAVVVVCAVTVLGALVLSRLTGTAHTRGLERENRQLVRQLEQQSAQFESVKSTLAELQRRDEAFRLTAGLEPLGNEVYSAGIGGSRNTSAAALDLAAMTRRAEVLRDSWEEAVATLRLKYDRLASTPSILPADGYLTSSFSKHRWHPLLDENRAHAGIDIAAPRGTPIYAAARARVVFVGPRGQYGLLVELDHGHGYITRYAHLASTNVRVGQLVSRREQIGAVGETGLAIGPHLHYEVLHNGVARNPIGFIFDGGAIPD